MKDGARTAFSEVGFELIAVFMVLRALNTIFMGEIAKTFGYGSMVAAPPVSIALPVYALLPLLLGTSLLTTILFIAAVRVFISDSDRIKQEYYMENVYLPAFRLILGLAAFFIIVNIGLAFFVVPGVYLFCALVLWYIFVINEDADLKSAFLKSWRTTRNHRMQIGFALLISIAVYVPLTLGLKYFFLVPDYLNNIVLGSTFSLFGVALLVTIYRELTDEASDENGDS